MELINEKLKKIEAFVFDVDGVMTDGSIIGTEDGHFLRSFNMKDGYAIQHAVKMGYHIAIISGGSSQGINNRFQRLGVTDIYTAQENKQKAFDEFLLNHRLDKSNVCYMGDDLPDYELMSNVGLAACPKDAAVDILAICQYVSPFEGGKGCVRDIIEKTMKIQEKWWNQNTHNW